MSLKVGIVGLPNVGKSTLFNALRSAQGKLTGLAVVGNYPFTTIEPNVGVVAIPDPRLDKLAEVVKEEEKMEHLPPIVPAVVEFVDIAGLVKGAHEGAGLGNKFLSYIREVDAIVHVLRDFTDPSASSGQAPIIREGSIDPKTDRETVETELALADLQTIEKLIFAQEKLMKTSKDILDKLKLNVLLQLNEVLKKGDSLKDFKIDDERLRLWFERLPLLLIKPTLYVYNVGEQEYKEKMEDKELKENEIVISAKLEQELADYSEEERLEYLKSMGIEQTGLERLAQKAYDLLGLISFLTAGSKEVRAWTIKKGMSAPKSAGVIHTDFEKNFIKAEVVAFDDFVKYEGWRKARELGKTRFEGKDYIMKDGDVVEFKVGV